jgi:hypothetical protein
MALPLVDVFVELRATIAVVLLGLVGEQKPIRARCSESFSGLTLRICALTSSRSAAGVAALYAYGLSFVSC